MAFIPVTNVSSFSMIFTQDNQRVQNTYYVKHVSGWLEAQQLAVCAELVSWWGGSLRSLVANNVALVQIDYRDWTTYDGIGGTYTTGLPLSGTGLTGGLPNNVTVAVGWKTGKRGRSYRGRTYHIGLMEDQVTGNQVNAGSVNALSAAYDDLRSAINAVPDCTMVQVSRYLNKTPRVTGAASTIIGQTFDPTVDSQRRRLPGRGG